MARSKLSFMQTLGAWMRGSKSVGIGELLPRYADLRARWATWDVDKAIREGLKASTWVYACVSRIALSAAGVPWFAEVRRGNDWEMDLDHPLTELMAKPNPWTSGPQLIDMMTNHILLGGNSLVAMLSAGGVVAELQTIDIRWIKPVPIRTGFIDHYLYQHGNVKKEIPAQDVIHTMLTDPSDPYWGLSPLQAGAKVVDTDVAAVDWNMVSLQNRAVPDTIISYKHDLTQPQWETARARIKEQHQGTENARTPWVLGNEAEVTRLGLTPEELDFINSRGLNREEICAIFQVPPPVVGIYAKATLADVGQARLVLWEDTVIPYLNRLRGGFNLRLAPRFGSGVRLNYDLSGVRVLAETMFKKIEAGERLFKMGVPLNSIIERLDLGIDPVPGTGDIPFLPATMMPAGVASASSIEEE